ncbi:hypothetical protein E2C01_006584 [Portunus trituberculatus]|uniref:Uncharacterized protein n=1 Tax=Portunus trituberculatus TaxID=210409 RepID=A0A5B7CZX6_PORTR|nr:hypothetical protein [Portunus trituberculatus]
MSGWLYQEFGQVGSPVCQPVPPLTAAAVAVWATISRVSLSQCLHLLALKGPGGVPGLHQVPLTPLGGAGPLKPLRDTSMAWREEGAEQGALKHSRGPGIENGD